MSMMDSDRFDVALSPTGIKSRVAVCGTCGAKDYVSEANRRLPAEVVAKKLRLRGWRIGRNGRDQCPDHYWYKGHKQAAIIEFPQEEKTMEEQPAAVPYHGVLPPVAEPPRQPTREDRRAVRDKLDECYDEGAGRYSGAWTDTSVALALNMPRAWVSSVRDDFFGPEANEADDAYAKAIASLATRLDKAETDLLTVLDTMEKGIADMKRDLEALKAGRTRTAA
jgi:hypothetical protein